jgi:hypothetical protein
MLDYSSHVGGRHGVFIPDGQRDVVPIFALVKEVDSPLLKVSPWSD